VRVFCPPLGLPNSHVTHNRKHVELAMLNPWGWHALSKVGRIGLANMQQISRIYDHMTIEDFQLFSNHNHILGRSAYSRGGVVMGRGGAAGSVGGHPVPLEYVKNTVNI